MKQVKNQENLLDSINLKREVKEAVRVNEEDLKENDDYQKTSYIKISNSDLFVLTFHFLK